jgi:hypothetical protein
MVELSGNLGCEMSLCRHLRYYQSLSGLSVISMCCCDGSTSYVMGDSKDLSVVFSIVSVYNSDSSSSYAPGDTFDLSMDSAAF